MASIKKDESGKYYFVLNIAKDPETGKRKQLKRRGFSSKKEAELALSKLKLDLENNNNVVNSNNFKLESFINKWFEAKKVKLRPSTIRNYQEQLNYNILPYLGEVKVKDIGEELIQSYIMTLHKERGLAPATIRSAYGVVAEVLKKAMRKGLLKEDVLSDISLPREVKKIRVWDEEDIYKFLDAPNKILNITRHFIGFSISIQTGMRMSEVLGLRWKDVDLENKMIYVRQTLARNDNNSYNFVDEGKTTSAIRVIYISDSLVESLKQHKSFLENEIKIVGNTYLKYDLVVCTQTGNWVHPNNFRRAFKVTIEQLNLPKIRLHDLRHTHSTYLLSKNVNPKIIQERLGHKNVNITLGVYSHALPSMQREAISKFDDLFKLSDHKSNQHNQ
ncbi:site-specific integrase [Halalkalibacter krulwichiae]|uniref:Transposase from transposon Tn916 n=1 Tax=Halalkalibacter krulwichiae TaxID=199441 RepID=A0A1X9MBC1_9BACI|nr:site-specific integrase [Halalkalibacter krulwichiae]ARK30749.1 Transposase from transposon Tn916 [Halalkalibacter krulwichiae]